MKDMKKRVVEITVNGETYPCYQTAGAMLRFKDLTGKEVAEIRVTDISDLIRFIWCCVVSACAREKKSFPLSLMDFADAMTPDQMQEWQDANSEEVNATDGQKKSPSA